MNILYIATRYHTNQVPVMRGWSEIGVKVRFMVQFFGVIESHEFVDLQVMRPSLFSRLLFRIIEKFYDSVKSETLKKKSFVPDILGMYNSIKEFRPDVVIIRNYRILGIIANIVCRSIGIKNVVIYTQYPIYGRWKEHGSFIGRLLMSIAPSATFSPVFFRGEYRERERRTGLAKYFVPLICDKPQIVRSKYCVNGKIRILDIGKYREYKKHFFIVDALSKVKHQERFELTIIGQLSNDAERDYFDKLDKYIKEKKLENCIHLRGHVGFKEMNRVYDNNDLLLLASSEPANISVLESMSKGLCVLASIENGTTCYIDDYKCGFTFSNLEIESLVNALDMLDKNQNMISEYGNKAQIVAKEELCFEKYRECLNKLLLAEYEYSII